MKFYLDEYGCAKNLVDAEYIVTALLERGDEIVEEPEDADVIVINTCAFIESAKQESLDAIFDARRDYPDKEIVVCGCLAERYHKELEKLSEIDTVYRNRNIKNITRKAFLGTVGSVYVKISEGCSNHCAYCAIPLIRGELKSRTIQSIKDEVEELVNRKTTPRIYEINLVAQDLASFGCDRGKGELPELLRALSEIEGDFIVRLLYIHPDHFPFEILDLMKKDKRFVPYFDLPFQSGSEKILKAMGRKGSLEKYTSLVQKIKEALPEAVIRTTFLAGFPGETDEDFKQTLELQKAIEPLWGGSFTYSREEGTPAFDYKNRVPRPIARKREKLLFDAQSLITEKLLKGYIGKTYRVIIDAAVVEDSVPEENEIFNEFRPPCKEGSSGLEAYGRAWWQAPDVDGFIVFYYEGKVPKTGSLMKVKVTSSTPVEAWGEQVEE